MNTNTQAEKIASTLDINPWVSDSPETLTPKHVQCVRETEFLLKQQPPQGAFVCDYAGLVINKLSHPWIRSTSCIRHPTPQTRNPNPLILGDGHEKRAGAGDHFQVPSTRLDYRDALLITNNPLLGPCSRAISRIIWWP